MSASFDYYRTFYYVAKYKNFTRAATMLLSSQPSVTRSIQNLESELSCRLFIRSRHGVTLTPEGEMLYRYVAPACERILRGEEELGLSLGLHGGAVSVGATETALHCLLLDRLALFQKEHPDVKIRISNGTTAHVLSDLKEGRTDVAVVPTPLQIEKPYSTVRLRPVRSILVGGPRFSALRDKPISLQELIQYPLAGLTEATMSHQFYENFFAAHGLPSTTISSLPAPTCCCLLLPIIWGLRLCRRIWQRRHFPKNALFRFPLQRKFRTATSVSCGIPAVLSALPHAA